MHILSSEDCRNSTRQLADGTHAIIWEMNTSRRCVYLDPRSAMMVSRERLCDEDWASCVHPDDAMLFADGLKRVWGGEQHTMEYRLLRSDGSVRWIVSNAAPRCDAEGNIVSVIFSLTDVTKHYESRERSLRSDAEHRLLTENAGDMIAHLDTEGRYIYLSPSHIVFFGYETEEMVGRRATDFLVTEDLERAAATRNTRPRGLSTVRGRRRDGGTFWISLNLRAVRDPQTGERKGVVAVGRDITTQVDAERELAFREERFRSLT